MFLKRPASAKIYDVGLACFDLSDTFHLSDYFCSWLLSEFPAETRLTVHHRLDIMILGVFFSKLIYSFIMIWVIYIFLTKFKTKEN